MCLWAKSVIVCGHTQMVSVGLENGEKTAWPFALLFSTLKERGGIGYGSAWLWFLYRMTTVIVGKERESPPAALQWFLLLLLATAAFHRAFSTGTLLYLIWRMDFFSHSSFVQYTHVCAHHTYIHTHTSSLSLPPRICENGRSKGGVEVIFRCHHATELRNETRLHILVNTVVDDRDIQ